MKQILLAGLCLVLICFSSCGDRVRKGEGSVTTVTPQVSSFNAVQVELPLKVTINVKKGAQPSVKLSGYASFLVHIKAKVENNMLYLSSDLDDRMAMDSKTVTAEVTTSQLNELYLSSTADADIHGSITAKSFKVEVTGKSDVTIDDVNTDNFSYIASGGSSLAMGGGSAKIASFSIDDNCIIKAFPFEVKESNVTVKGNGKCELSATKKLNTNIAASGDVKYKGHPFILKNPEGGTINDAN